MRMYQGLILSTKLTLKRTKCSVSQVQESLEIHSRVTTGPERHRDLNPQIWMAESDDMSGSSALSMWLWEDWFWQPACHWADAEGVNKAEELIMSFIWELLEKHVILLLDLLWQEARWSSNMQTAMITSKWNASSWMDFIKRIHHARSPHCVCLCVSIWW